MLTARCANKFRCLEPRQDVRGLAELVNERWDHAPNINIPVLGKALYEVHVGYHARRSHDAMESE